MQQLNNESIIPAKTGYTVLSGDKVLHSRYDPAAEAEKYIDSLDLKPFKYFILLEPGLGYLADSLKNRFPQSMIISLHCSSFFKNRDFSWNPSFSETLEDFLEHILSDADASEIKIIDWKPSINIYGKSCLDLALKTVECVKRISAGRKTVKVFGKRWIKNAIKNISMLKNIVIIKPSTMPVLVCAAGPSLNDSITNITNWKNSWTLPVILSVSSASTALLYNGIMPNSIVTTDGGAWANFHLFEYFRSYKNTLDEKPVIASALIAALPSQAKDYPVQIIRDGSLWQDLLLKAAGILQYSFVFPQRGTVSVSALDMAFFLSKGEIYICGMDLSHQDLLTHVRPYAFEKFLEQKQSRKKPLYSQIFEREDIIRSSGSHDIYASWFKSHLSLFPRLYAFGESKYGIPAGKPDSNKTKNILCKKKCVINSINKKRAVYVLNNALDDPLTKDQLGKELAELLFGEKPAENKNCTNELKKILLELADG